MAQESWNRDGAEGTGCQPPEGPLLCVNNCGFIGCAATMNMCSKCYREVVLKQGSSSPSRSQAEMASPLLGEKALMSVLSEKPATVTASQTTSEQADLPSLKTKTTEMILYSPEVSDACSSSQILPSAEPVSTSVEESSVELQHQQPRRQTANKCFTCRRRVGLLGFKCRCGDVFCSLHRYSEKHNCSFDYKAAGRDAIAKANPLVKADKIQRI